MATKVKIFEKASGESGAALAERVNTWIAQNEIVVVSTETSESQIVIWYRHHRSDSHDKWFRVR